ncbi:hypothetical protein KKC22_10640 [Myxococcota bacterium]|nr:hypothetical protein [Myxococcota bacterium]
MDNNRKSIEDGAVRRQYVKAVLVSEVLTIQQSLATTCTQEATCTAKVGKTPVNA